MGQLAGLLALVLGAANGPQANDGLSWHWDRDAPGCSLEQKGPDAKTIDLSRDPGQDETRITFNVRTPKFWKGVYDGGSVTLSNGVSFPARVQVYSADNDEYRLRATIEGSAFPRALSGTSSVTISHRGFGEFKTSIRDAGPAAAALRTCEDGRLRGWGIDIARYWQLSSRAKPTTPLAELFESSIYPAIATSRSIERNLIAKLQIGADGSVGTCETPGDFAYPQFTSAVCGVLTKRARFQPATDASGNPVSSPYVVIVSFRMGRY